VAGVLCYPRPREQPDVIPADAVPPERGDFIREIVAADLREGRQQDHRHPAFPPEPNGYLHIGHAQGDLPQLRYRQRERRPLHLRFDDTNPMKEEQE